VERGAVPDMSCTGNSSKVKGHHFEKICLRTTSARPKLNRKRKKKNKDQLSSPRLYLVSLSLFILAKSIAAVTISFAAFSLILRLFAGKLSHSLDVESFRDELPLYEKSAHFLDFARDSLQNFSCEK
tara:strand:+ start:3994 stop:4374 length:381 start_codon:yes stop_codon:yes gene_type:complete